MVKMVKRLRLRDWLVLSLLLVLAAALRLYGLDWDGAIGAHPDERYVVGVAESLRTSGSLDVFAAAPDLAYGHLPVYVLAMAMGGGGADPLLVGRALAAMFDVGTVALTFALGRQLWGRQIGLLAAALVTPMVLHVQRAHFYTVDGMLAFFVLGALLFAARLAWHGRAREAWLAGAWTGLALASKLGAVFLLIPLWAACSGMKGARAVRWQRVLQVGCAALVVFALTSPYAFLSFPAFWRNVAREAVIAGGTLDVPYTRQFYATYPYVYPIVQQVLWGMGMPLGVAGFGGLAYWMWRAARRPLPRGAWVTLMWAVPFFAFTGALYAQFPRYLLPLTPVLAVYAGWALVTLTRRIRSWLSPHTYSFLLSSIPVFISLTCTFLHCVVFLRIYSFPHPWLAATNWFREHVVPGAVVAVEQWDHPLPLEGAGDYVLAELPVFDEDTPEKWAAMEAVLGEADYLVIASRRAYAALARWPERYPLTTRYYKDLFAGKLGFEVVACFRRDPRLGPLAVADDPMAGFGFSLPERCEPDAPLVLTLPRLDESFVVYDHPLVVVFQRVKPRGD